MIDEDKEGLSPFQRALREHTAELAENQESRRTTLNALGDKAETDLVDQRDQADQDSFNQRIEAGMKLHGVGGSVDSKTRAEITNAHMEENRLMYSRDSEDTTLSGIDPQSMYTNVGGYPGNPGTLDAFNEDLAEGEKQQAEQNLEDQVRGFDLNYVDRQPAYDRRSDPDSPEDYKVKERQYVKEDIFGQDPEPKPEAPAAVVTDPADPAVLAQTGEINREPSVVSLDDETHEGRNSHRRSGGAGMIFSGARNALNNAATAVGQEFRRLTEVTGNSNLEQTPMPNNIPAPNPSDNPYGLDSDTDSLKPFPFTTEPAPVAVEPAGRQTHNLNPKPSFIDKIMVKANPLDDPVGEYFENELSKEPEAPTPAEPVINTTPTTNTLINPDNSTIATAPPDSEPALQVEPQPAQPIRRHIQLQPGVHGGHDSEDVILGSTATPESDSGQARMTEPLTLEQKRQKREQWKSMSHWEKSLYKINKVKQKLNEKSSEVLSQVESGSKTVMGSTMPDLLAGAFAGATTEQVLKRTKVIESGLLSIGLGLAAGAAAGAGSAASREIAQIFEVEKSSPENLLSDIKDTFLEAENRKKILKSLGNGAILGLIGAYAGQKLADIILEESKKRRGK